MAVTVSPAVVPAIAKSASPTSFTSSLKVTRHVRVSAWVGEVVGVWRSIAVTRGAVVSVALGVTWELVACGAILSPTPFSARTWKV